MSNYGKNASTHWSWHDRMTNTSQIWGKRAQNTGRQAESEGKKENPTILFLAAEPQSGFLREATSCSASLWAEELSTGSLLLA